jgi:hypothetical protein
VTSDPAPARRRRPASLGFAVLGAPAAWAAHLGLSYFIVPRACATGTTLWLHLVTAATAGVALAATVLAVQVRAGGRARDDAGARFLGALGIVIGALFFAATLVEGLPVVFIDPCR